MWTKPLLDSLVDPVLQHLPEATKADHLDPQAVNVRFWVDQSRDVYFGHAISDKNSRNAESVGQFPYIFHSGPRWQRKYLAQGLRPSQLRQVGYTKLDAMVGLTQQRHTVLWAPSWSVNWRRGYALMNRLIRRLDVEVSRHSLDAPHNNTVQALIDADVVIADGGGTLYEAWALDKPVVFPDFAVKGLISPGSIESEIYERQVGYHARRPKDLPEAIKQARDIGITKPEQDFIEDVFPRELRGRSGEVHAQALREIAR